jgi:glutaredoxin
MSSSRTIPLYAFINYLASGDRSHLPEKNTEFYKIQEFAKIEIPIDSRIKELKDFNFDAGIEFKRCHFQTTIRFSNCKGRGGIKFSDCTAFEFDSNDPRPSLEFQNFTFDHLVIENCNLPGGIFFEQIETKEEPNILSSLKISNSTFANGGISLNKIKFKHDFEFISIKKCGPIKLKDLETTKQCTFTLVTADSLKVSGENLKMGGDLKFTKSTFPVVFFEKAQIGGNLKFYEPQIKGQLSIFGSTIGGRTLISSYPEVPLTEKQKTSFETYLPSIFIHSTDFVEGFSLEGKEKATNNISLDFSPLLKGRLEFKNVNIKNLELKGTNSENNIYLCVSVSLHVAK